jgi:hypothetical protein
MASKGRNGDSMLVHMTPGEVAGLHALALKHGGELTINPDTGLPEANFLKSLLPMLAGAALNFFVPGLGAAVGGAFGLGAAAGTGIAVGGLTTLATGSLSRGLMAGMGAYGGAGLAEGLTTAGLQSEVAANLPTVPSEGLTQAQIPDYIKNVENARGAAIDKFGGMGGMDKLSAGFDAAKNAPGAFLKDNLMPLGMAAAPIMADMMVPTTTKMPAATDTGYIRQKVFDPGSQTYRSLTPVKASEFGSRNFSDIYRGYNGGGIVALAGGGDAALEAYQAGDYGKASQLLADAGMNAQDVVSKYGLSQADAANVAQNLGYTGDMSGIQYAAPATQASSSGLSADAARNLIEAQYATIGRSGVGTGANQIDEAGLNAWTNALVSGEFKPEDLSSRFGTAVTDYMAQNPDDQYTQYVKDYQAKQATTGGGGVSNLDTTGGGTATVADTSGIATLNNAATGTNLNAFSNAYTGANINDYIANNNLDAAGIAAAAKQFNVDPAQIVAAQNAQNIVTNVYRNVLGRDPDPAGLSWWTNQIMNGDRTGAEMYAEFQKSAKSLLGTGGTKELFKEMSLENAVKDFGGYQSADKRTIADEWVRNTLGREVTEDDRKQQWYKDAANSSVMTTVGKAEDIYSKFKDFARDNASTTVAQQIKDAKATLSKNGLTEMDVLRQTGKTIAELVGSGINLENDLFKASQLRKPGEKAGFDFNTIKKPVIPNTFTKDDGTGDKKVVDRFETNPYGNVTNPGDLTYNRDGTVTVTPNIPYRPYGGFSGMGEVKNAYTQGGGSLGYTPRVVNSADEHDELYNRFTPGGDSEAAYNYLMGKGGAKYPTKSTVGEIARPYREATMGYPTSTNKAYNYDAATGKMVRNPDYVAPGRDAAGNVNYTLSLSEMKKYLTANPLSGQALYDWAQENGASAQDVADATGRKLSEVYAEFRAASKKVADAKKTDTTNTDAIISNTNDGGGGGGEAAGGLQQSYAMGGYAVGGGLGSLGSYSDGGRLLKGPGDGVSDSIPATIGQKQQPARLADGEFVVPARIVSELGNGSTEAGAKKLYAMMDRVQRARGKTTGKNKVAANSRADKYLPA